MKINGKEYVLLWTSESTNQKPNCYNLNSQVDKKIILGGLYQTLLNFGMPQIPGFSLDKTYTNEEYKEIIETLIQKASGTKIFGPYSGWIQVQGQGEDNGTSN